MRIAVIGAGAIGGLVAGYLKEKGEDVSLIGRANSVKVIKERGLHLSGVRGEARVKIDVFEKLEFKPDLLILAVKTQDLASALEANLEFSRGTVVLTTQNGMQADNIAARYILLENIVSSIVMFGSTCLGPASIVHNFEGKWIIGRLSGQNDGTVSMVSETLNKIFPTIVTENLLGMKYLKIFVNANNCIPAILGLTMQEAFADIDISRISIAIWREGLDIVSKSGRKLVSLPDFSTEKLTSLTSLPISEAAGIFSNIMKNLSKEPLYGSILQSIKRGSPSEIDYINGEFVNIAKEKSLSAPLNEKLVWMVHQVEETGRFFSRVELLNNTKQFLG